MRSTFYVNVRGLARRQTGVERYTFELVSRLKDEIVALSPGRKRPGGWGHWWEQVELPRRLSPADVLWSPANTGPLNVANQVITVHDLSTLEHPEWFHPHFAAWYRYLLPRLVKRARRVATVSEYTKGRIVDLLKVPEDKIAVILPGVDPERFHPEAGFQPAVNRSTGLQPTGKRTDGKLPERYVLFVGSLEPRKNLRGLLEAWRLVQARLSAGSQPVELILAGSPGGPFRDPKMGDLPPCARRLGYVDEARLPGLYAGALALVLPSLYEGFGLPVLEAMSCGTPVIASRRAGLVEAGGEAALYFDPLNAEAIASALRQVIEDSDLRREMRTNGLEHARNFTWERAASQLREVMHDACQ
jgi:glycosyltransferase involved in cell wall biosynthesis